MHPGAEDLKQVAAALGVDTDDRLPAVEYSLEAGQPGWNVRTIDVVEEISGVFAARVELERPDDGLDASELLMTPAALVVARPGLLERRFTGLIRVVEQSAWTRRSSTIRCEIIIEPALACLSQDRRTHKFQDVTVPAILREVLSHGLQPFKRQAAFNLKREADHQTGYAVRELCVQYGESTLRFVQRLMSEEGITYFLEHQQAEADDPATEVVHLVDDMQDYPSLGSVPFVPPMAGATTGEAISRWELTQHGGPSSLRLRAFDYTRPRLALEREIKSPDNPAAREGLVDDPHHLVALSEFKDDHYTKSDVEPQTRLRWEEAQAARVLGSGESQVISFAAGRRFAFDGENEYLLTTVHHQGSSTDAGGVASGRPAYSNTFTCVPATVPFRSPLIPKPRAVQDLGVVVSASDSDPIYTDLYGRVRVRFVYDDTTYATADECSPWLPVAQGWAGDNYGLQIIPRAGMLVLLRYLHGDPDRPVVAGCLPTGVNTLPSPPPHEKTRLTLRTRSLRSGGHDHDHYNELTLDDEAEHEQYLVRAGRDYRRKVLRNESVRIDHDAHEQVGGSQTLEVKGPRTKTVHGDETIHVDQKRHTTIAGDSESHIFGNATTTVERDAFLTVEGERHTTVTKLEKATFHDGRQETVTGTDTLTVTKQRKVTVTDEFRAEQGGSSWSMKDSNIQLVAGRDISLKVNGAQLTLSKDGHATLRANASIQIQCGEASITLKPDQIDVAAPTVQITGTNGALTLDANGATTTGLNIESTALASNEVTGAFVKANS